ncbi:MAG TPA: methyltransferase domain-containing protein [Pseudonocardiaceae bacterium]|nr:methyltransferase domain-containing protein [Pseudonocardiaceae bacterium]
MTHAPVSPTAPVSGVADQDWMPRAVRLAEEATAAAAMNDPAWRPVIAAVPRHVFVPTFWALDAYNRPDIQVRDDDPAQHATWLDAAYANRSLVTRWAPDTRSDGTAIRVVTSSASQPSVMATMLDRLQLTEGMRVLEIGTGTGYHAGLLSRRLGAENVTSIDIDPALVEAARHRLAAAGYQPRLHIGDGSAPLPGPAQRFDRIIATCAVRRVPPAWITQLAPGGRLVTPLEIGGAFAVLDAVTPTQISGRIDPAPLYFMTLRNTCEHTMPPDYAPPIPPTDPAAAHHGLTQVDPRALDEFDFQLWLALHHPSLRLTHHYRDGAPVAAIVYTAHERAITDYQPAQPQLWPVRQHHGRPWDTVESAWHSFTRTGRPPRHRIGLTAHANDHQHLWLDTPDSAYTWPAPSPR